MRTWLKFSFRFNLNTFTSTCCCRSEATVAYQVRHTSSYFKPGNKWSNKVWVPYTQTRSHFWFSLYFLWQSALHVKQTFSEVNTEWVFACDEVVKWHYKILTQIHPQSCPYKEHNTSCGTICKALCFTFYAKEKVSLSVLLTSQFYFFPLQARTHVHLFKNC